jgi:hypothetical protein
LARPTSSAGAGEGEEKEKRKEYKLKRDNQPIIHSFSIGKGKETGEKYGNG